MKNFVLSFLVLSVFSACSTGNNPDQEFDIYYEGSAGVDDVETTLDTEAPSKKIENITNNTTMEFNQTALPKKGEEIVVMQTTKGTMKMRLFPNEAPKTVENFTGLIKKGYYDGIIFHRVIPDFMIQGGDPTGTGTGGESIWGGKFEDEFDGKGKNIRGALSMANAGPNTNGSQFFVVQAESTPWLDGRHTVFAQVFEGVDIIDEIINVERNGADKPLEDVIMLKVTLEKF
ncbi:peptidylprolyl isomerase [Candidatus Peregrinibacteria bacterium]|jgi:peptidyl-prolyl cis-trans isomerase B (cyclophilin B)|nr:peptidylprolyl isomerase [Candidatus Peregrinibacteria bacterium]